MYTVEPSETNAAMYIYIYIYICTKLPQSSTLVTMQNKACSTRTLTTKELLFTRINPQRLSCWNLGPENHNIFQPQKLNLRYNYIASGNLVACQVRIQTAG